MTSAPLFRTAAVLGSGTMGSQIAAHLANAGLTVELLDLKSEEGPPNAVADQALAAATKLNPNPFFSADVVRRIRTGNLEDDFDRVGQVDLVVEAVVERLDIKRKLFARVEEVARDDAVIATNTSGLPIASIAEGRGEGFRKRFLGSHFFNPPRYLRLFELIPTADTDPGVIERVSEFARLHLGKGVVVAKDTPNFIGNRIGIYAAMQAVRMVTEHGYTVEEVDQLTGRLIGHARSATFRTADLVGLDVLVHVAQNLHEAVENDESREAFRTPWLLAKLAERGSLGAKTKEGFYKKVDGKILSIDPESMEYTAPRGKKLEHLDDLKKVRPLEERLRKLFADKGRVGDFFRDTTLDLLAYAARRVPEIADEVVDVDRALRLGFGWELGPFQIWDALGFQAVRDAMVERHLALPGWIEAMAASGATSFYGEATDDSLSSWSPPAGAHLARDLPADELTLARVNPDDRAVVWSNDECALVDLGEGVACFEFRSKMNTLGAAVIAGLHECIGLVEEGPWAGLVIGNDAEHFTVGANLFEVAMGAAQGHWDELDEGIARFQGAGQRIRYASKPVVVCTVGRVLGGGCEFTLWCPHPVAAAESYIGLVEIGAGLIPAGGGTTLMTALAAERAASDQPDHIAAHLRVAFETVATAHVATSAHAARERGFVAPAGTIVMNAERRLFVAKREVLRLAAAGYRPPPVRTAIPVLGPTGRGAFEVGVQHMLQGGFIGEHDAMVAGRIAWVMTGGDVIAPTTLHEDRLLELEREVFLSLLGEKATLQKIGDLLPGTQAKAALTLAKGVGKVTSVFRRKRKPKGNGS